jgi:hypothetical protein
MTLWHLWLPPGGPTSASTSCDLIRLSVAQLGNGSRLFGANAFGGCHIATGDAGVGIIGGSISTSVHAGRSWRGLQLTPGITGPGRSAAPSPPPLTEMAKLDYHHISNWSMWQDIDILLRTAQRVIRQSNAKDTEPRWTGRAAFRAAAAVRRRAGGSCPSPRPPGALRPRLR